MWPVTTADDKMARVLVVDDSRATLEDRLQHSAILKQSNPAEFASFLANRLGGSQHRAGSLTAWRVAVTIRSQKRREPR